jgi:hypothetical protein
MRKWNRSGHWTKVKKDGISILTMNRWADSLHRSISKIRKEKET